MSVHVAKKAFISVSSIREHSAAISSTANSQSPLRLCPRLNHEYGTKHKNSYRNTEFCSLNDAVVVDELDTDELIFTSIDTVETDHYDDDTDSAYSSLEEGNLPELHLLVEADLSVIGHGIHIYPPPKRAEQNLWAEQHVEPIEYNLNARLSENKQPSINEDDETTATCSKHLEGEKDDSDVTKNVAEKQAGTVSNAPIDSQEERPSIYNNNISDEDTIIHISDENAGEDLLQAFVTDSDVYCTESVAPIPNGTKKDESNIGLNEHQSRLIDDYVDLEKFDTFVGKAYEESVKSQSLSPLIKEELKCVIQCRRLLSGQPEIFVEPEEPKEYKLRDEEVQKKHARLEQNRKSAKKARHRARESESVLIKYINEAEKAQENLIQTANQFRRERDQQLAALKAHLDVCRKNELVDTQKRILKYMSSNF